MSVTLATQRSGFSHISSMTAVCKKPFFNREAAEASAGEPPWKTHVFGTCKHQNTRVRLKRFETGDRACAQCLDCGRKVGQWVAKAGVLEFFDEDLLERVSKDYEQKNDAYITQRNLAISSEKQSRDRLWWDVYGRYLKTAVWAVKREKVLERCGGVCECCGQRQATQVHHLEYPDVFGHEPLWTLRGICVPCHKIIHPHMR